MSDETRRFDLDALNARVAADAGAPEFPALAEALRRSGEAARAKDVAEAGLESAPSRLAGRVALALARMDLGEPDLGRRQLETVLDEMLEPYRLETEAEAPLTPIATEPQSPSAFAAAEPAPTGELDAVDDQEIDAAFDEAEAQPDEMHSPNRMAESILDDEAPFEGDDELSADEDESSGAGSYDVAASGAFATRTMAGLLEQQGDHARAQSIRTSLDGVRHGDPLDVAAEAAPLELDSGLELGSRPEAGAWEAEPPIEVDELGEEQDFAGADVERASIPTDAAEAVDLAAAPVGHGDAPEPDRARVLATLERWLHNLHRGVA